MRLAAQLFRHSIRVPILDAIKNGVTSNVDPFKQFRRFEFQHSSLTQLPTLLSGVHYEKYRSYAAYRANASQLKSF